MFESSINWIPIFVTKQVNFTIQNFEKTPFKRCFEFWIWTCSIVNCVSAGWELMPCVSCSSKIEVKRFWNFEIHFEFHFETSENSECSPSKLNCPHWTMTLILELLELSRKHVLNTHARKLQVVTFSLHNEVPFEMANFWLTFRKVSKKLQKSKVNIHREFGKRRKRNGLVGKFWTFEFLKWGKEASGNLILNHW